MKFDMEEVMEIEHTFGKGSKKPTDPNAPKRPMSAYFLYANKMRPQVMKDHPDATVGQIGKMLGNMWKQATDSEKAPHEKLAKKNNEQYHTQREKYEKSMDYRKHQMTMLAWKIHATKKPFGRDENAPKKAPSAYMLYAASVRKQIVEENPDMTSADIMKEQSVMWKALSDEERAPWNVKGAAEKKKYQAKVDRYMKTADYRNFVAAREKYKKEMIEKRNKLMGIKKRARSTSQRRPAKKMKRSRSRSRSRARRRSTSRRRTKSRGRRASKRRSRTPKASRRSRKKSRRSRTPKASRSRSARRSKARK